MPYFLTSKDVKRGRKVIHKGRIVTAIDLAGESVRIAEDGQWHRHVDMQPLADEQLREAKIQDMLSHCEGKAIVTLKPLGKGVQFVLDDNTRIGLDYASDGTLALSVIEPEGTRVL